MTVTAEAGEGENMNLKRKGSQRKKNGLSMLGCKFSLIRVVTGFTDNSVLRQLPPVSLITTQYL